MNRLNILGLALWGMAWFLAGALLFGKIIIPRLSRDELPLLALILFSIAGILSAVLIVIYLHVRGDDEIR
ncbi:MAG: hypothetical protein M1285_01730 [Candidatus Thermoplasmatota archaeon]|jgi:membrane protein DedA with SNARE-associated domain|nr:hypothetical protein [Candidatus Thermoplasmatota archaeon]